jgi:hypothetical protein
VDNRLWHRQWLRRRWAQRSKRARPGRPSVDAAIRALVDTMAGANPLWGAPRIHVRRVLALGPRVGPVWAKDTKVMLTAKELGRVAYFRSCYAAQLVRFELG